MSKKIDEKAMQLAQKLIDEQSFKELELVDVEYVKEKNENYLRVLIDRQGGVTLEDCEEFSRAFDVRLDEEDFIPDAYYLEVSSPGLDRELKKDRDFIREKGKKILIKLYKKSDYGKEILATLDRLDDDDNLVVEIDGEKVSFPMKEVAKVNLNDFEF